MCPLQSIWVTYTRAVCVCGWFNVSYSRKHCIREAGAGGSNPLTPTIYRCSFNVLWQSFQIASCRSSSLAHLWHTKEYLWPLFKEGMAVITSSLDERDSLPWLTPFQGPRITLSGDGWTFECDGGHILGVKRGFNVGIRRNVKRRSMYRVARG